MACFWHWHRSGGMNFKLSAEAKGMTKFASGLTKIRSMTVDTNVISDLVSLAAVYGPLLERGETIPAHRQPHYEQCVLSKLAVFIMLDFDVERIGLKAVYRELLEKPPLHIIYRNIFPAEAKITREAKNLAEKYSKKFSIASGDAAIVALCSTNSVDVLLTWNREHLLKTIALEEIERINRESGVQTPEILSPAAFRDRLMLTGKKLSLSPRPVLPVYRVGFSPSRRAP